MQSQEKRNGNAEIMEEEKPDYTAQTHVQEWHSLSEKHLPFH
jgi:hypothetical protein